jgi:hypothetical protein
MNRCFHKILLLLLAGISLLSIGCQQSGMAKTGDNSSVNDVSINKPSEKTPTAANLMMTNDSAKTVARQKPKPSNSICAKPKTLAYEKFSAYVNDYWKRRNGECVVVSDVPLFSGIKNAEDEYGNHKGLYYLENEKQTDVGDTFPTSAALAKDLLPVLKKEARSLRVTAVLIQFSNEFEVFRSPYAIKVEGLDENGQALWTVTGKPPAKLKFPV